MDLQGKEHVEGYLCHMTRGNRRPRTMYSRWGTILIFLGMLRDNGKTRLEEVTRRDVGAFIEHERPMLVMFVPTKWKKVLDYPDLHKYNAKSVLIAITGAGVNPAQQKKRILKAFPNAVVVDVFGQTEMAPDTTFHLDAVEDGLKDRCMGKPLPGL